MTTSRATRGALATIATLALALAACGGGDDDADPAADAPAEEQGDEPAAEPADDAADDEQTDDGGDDGGSDDQTDGGDDQTDDGDDGGSDAVVARSLDDIPDRCRDAMGEYFRAVEPIVSDIDWETASFEDLEQIGTDVEDASAAFDEDAAAEGCDDIDFPDGNEFELLIEFARDEAPGVVGYLEFIDGLGVDSGGDTDSEEGAIPTPGEGFADCGEAVDYVQGLVDEYGTFQNVPASDIMQIAGLSSVIQTCTPEQLEFFESAEVAEFLGGG